MTIIDDGIQGAKRQSTRPNPMPIVIEVVESRKKGSDPYSAKLCHEFRHLVETNVNSEDLVDVIWEYYWVNAVHRCTKQTPTPEERNAKRTARAAAVERVKAEMKAQLDAKAKRMYLEMIMPNGKQLGDCTGRDIKAMKGDVGIVLGKLASSLKLNQKTRSIYSTNEELVAALLK